MLTDLIAIKPGHLVRQVGLVLAGSWLLALLAQPEIPLPFSPVPITLQTLGVLLIGALLGPQLAIWSLLLYLSQGLAGLPVFSGGGAGPAHLLGPTGGFLWSFPLAAGLVGWLFGAGADQSFGRALGAMLAGNLVIYLCGAAWLAVSLPGVDFGRAVSLGVVPFLLGDLIKAVTAASALPWLGRKLG